MEKQPEKIVNIKEDFPLISFVMPVYNDGDAVEKAIESIFDQDWPNVEVIAVNDGSTDNTGEVLAKLSKKHKRLTVIDFKENRGACTARNEGAKVAREHSAKYYAWLPADARIYPGMVRIWTETLEKFPDYDFLYGGYRFIDEEGIERMNYMSDKFEPYLLECANYIDGSFPIRAETYWRVAKLMNQPDGLWDPNVKSLQDWDFWLSVVKEGKGKGFYYQDIFFETILPHPGGLSYDSHQNWLARTNQIKRKHNIPDRKICLTAPGAPFFAKYLAYILDADYKDHPALKDHDYDLIYLLGFYPSIAELSAEVFIDPKVFGNYQDFVKMGRDVPLSLAIKAVHLIGTDLLQMSDLPRSHLKVYQHFLNNKYDYVFTEYRETWKEAKELGIETEILPLPPRKYFEVTPFPKKFTVAVYAPPINQALYCTDLMKDVARKMPEADFKFFGDPKLMGRDGNITHVGFVGDMDEFIKDCSCLLRITTHDGLPQSVLEFLSAGRRVVFNHDFNYVNQAGRQLNAEVIVKALRSEMKQGVNPGAARWIRKNFSKEKFKKKVESLMTYNPKRYWERRAERWASVDVGIYQMDIWESIKPFVKKFRPKSVIDIGCGDGRYSDKFREMEIDYFGIDISEKLVEIAKKRFPKARFKASSLEDLKTDGRYDLAFCLTVFEHIPEGNMPKAIENLKKYAKNAILVEPVNIKTKNYCHNHDYHKWFDIVEEKNLGDKTLMVAKL